MLSQCCRDVITVLPQCCHGVFTVLLRCCCGVIAGLFSGYCVAIFMEQKYGRVIVGVTHNQCDDYGAGIGMESSSNGKSKTCYPTIN